MLNSTELLFFFSGLGVFNGLILSAYFLFFTKKSALANKFLGLLLLLLSIRIGKSVIFFFHRDLGEFYRQIGLSACFLIGPSLYYYLKTELKGIKSIAKSWKVSFGALILVPIVVGAAYPYELYPVLWNTLIVGIIYHFWMAWILLSGWVAWSLVRKLVVRTKHLTIPEIWILCVYLGNVLIFLAYYLVPYTPYIVGALSFSLVLYLLLFVLFFGQAAGKKQPKEERYNNQRIPDTEVDIMQRRLDHLMQEAKIFSNPKLKIGDVAAAMDLSIHRLSQFLNDNLGQNYSSYINQWRVELAKELIAKHHHLSLEGIGAESGFPSRSTFYAVFKKTVGMTPAQYRKVILASSGA